jgi:Myosin heavy chain
MANLTHSIPGVLGIPFMDVVRVLAAVLLLGNVQFVDKSSSSGNNGTVTEVGVNGESTLNSVASLLGVPSASLFRGNVYSCILTLL